MNFQENNTASTTTRVIFANQARKELYAGLKIAADAVSCTLGPKGKTVLIQQQGSVPLVTKDGVTVSRSVKLKDPVQRMGAELIREAANRTNEVAGDGTTTATVLTHSMVQEGLKLLEGGYSATNLCKGLEKTTQFVVEAIKRNAKKLTTTNEVAQVGTISANGDVKIGQLIAEAMQRVGTDGIITVEDAKGTQTSMDITEGMQFERGYLSPYFVTNNDKMNVVQQNAYVLVTDKKLTSLRELIPILEKVIQTQSPLLIIADDVEGEALQGLVLNRIKTNLPVVAIKAPGYATHKSELLQDICVLTGATLVSSVTGVSFEQVGLKELGRCKKVIVDSKTTTLVSDTTTKESVEAHVTDLKTQLEDVTLDTDEITKLKMRIAKLSSGVAVIKVGGATEVEMIERKYRIEDALNATRAAAEEGIVSGGGMALAYIANTLHEFIESIPDPEERMGGMIVLKACLAPLRGIAYNASLSSDVLLAKLKTQYAMSNDNNVGYNVDSGELCDMFSFGVIDPAKVTRTALQNAASVAVTFLTLDAVVVEDPVERQ